MRIGPFGALAATLVLGGCEANVFPVEVTGETTIPGDPSPIPELLMGFPAVGSFTNIDFNQSQEFQNQGVTKDQVKSVRMDYVKLEIVSPPSQDFSFLESIEFYARAGDDEVLVAERHDIASLDLVAPNPTLGLEVTEAELQPFVTAPSMSLVVRGNGRLPPEDTRIEATVGIRVEVKVF